MSIRIKYTFNEYFSNHEDVEFMFNLGWSPIRHLCKVSPSFAAVQNWTNKYDRGSEHNDII